LNLSERQVIRLKGGILQQGPAFIIHKNRGRKPSHALSGNTQSEIIKLKQSKYQEANFEHYQALSVMDELTGLYNHRFFQEKLQEFLQQDEPISLLMLDLDNFKRYNDIFGHPKGDKLLQELSEILKNNTPEDGVVCRYGGEEFTIILPNIESNEALEIAENIRNSVAEFGFYGKADMPNKTITISIGVSTYPFMAKTKEELITFADQALYKSKTTSRNRVQLYSSVIDDLKSVLSDSREEELVPTVKTFLTIINSKDRYTFGHTERIMQYAELLACKIGLSPEDIKFLRYGALLHDIGKLEVPSECLNKRTKLSIEEWEIIKNHVIWGEQIIEPIKELTPCISMVRNHHERYDGKGYPDGLAGEAIPLTTRILTLVDSFDAMTTNRPYQTAKTGEQAIEEMRKCSGTQFDPYLVEPFIEVLYEHFKLKFALSDNTEVNIDTNNCLNKKVTVESRNNRINVLENQNINI
jgi:diguanylate cyclase (GGDEF)-like protein/putative nucleotidyltransferase with HDIG domain